MPPLAHLLAPQIMARAREFEAALGPPEIPRRGYLADVSEYGVTTEQAPTLAPQPTPPPKEKPKAPEKKPERVAGMGYLAQQNVGYEKTPYDPRGLLNKSEGKVLTRGPLGQMLEAAGTMYRSSDPTTQRVGRAFLAGMDGKTLGQQQGAYHTPQAGQAADKGGEPTMSMLAPVPYSREPIGFTERGEAIYAAPPAPAQQTRGPLKLKRGDAAGIDETGEHVDPRGRKLGYLTPSAPMGSVGGKPMNDAARRKRDAPIDGVDKFGAGALIELYTPHLKARQEHFQDTGKETFPPGYFNGMTPGKRKEIEEGVKALHQATVTGQAT